MGFLHFLYFLFCPWGIKKFWLIFFFLLTVSGGFSSWLFFLSFLFLFCYFLSFIFSFLSPSIFSHDYQPTISLHFISSLYFLSLLSRVYKASTSYLYPFAFHDIDLHHFIISFFFFFCLASHIRVGLAIFSIYFLLLSSLSFFLIYIGACALSFLLSHMFFLSFFFLSFSLMLYVEFYLVLGIYSV
ncbi:hypothetical protein DFH27DRAFT_396761 [Peziza echinospora]|nr:hypothetical protein DFH27DRAFT_396761 [Peziza echinospora]